MATIYTAWQRDKNSVYFNGWTELKVYRNDDPGFSREGLEVWLATMKAMPEVDLITKEKIQGRDVGVEKDCIVWKKSD